MKYNKSRPQSVNVLLLSVIFSVVAHLIFAYSHFDMSSDLVHSTNIEQSSDMQQSITSKNIRLPIEFIPFAASSVKLSFTSTDTIRQIIEEANASAEEARQLPKLQGYYSFNDRQAILKRYLGEIRQHIEAGKYTAALQGSTLVGNVTLHFDILVDGSFNNVAIVRTSGVNALDRAALSAVVSASGQVKRPKVIGAKGISMSATIKYQFGL